MTDQTDAPAAAPDEWAIVEMMGHRQLAGRVTEVVRYGATLMRIDVPAGEGFVTKLLGGAGIYAVTIVAESVARAAAACMADPRPIAPAEFRPRPALEQRASEHPQQENEVDDDRPF